MHAAVCEVLMALCDTALEQGAWDETSAAAGLEMARSFAKAATEKGVVPLEIGDSDVARFAMSGVSFYCKNVRMHEEFSVKTSQVSSSGSK